MTSYRKCAGIIVFNADKKVLVCARNDDEKFNWQFPQGGIDSHETLLDAAIRELKEETSIVSVQPIITLDNPIRYNYPPEVLSKAKFSNKKHLGQEMYWSLMFFYGNDDEINLNTKEPEFKAHEWVEPEEAINRIVLFKKDVYKKALKQLQPYISAFDTN